MWPSILKYGAIAGAIAGGSLLVVALSFDGQPPPDWGMAAGFASMLVALSALVVAVKRHRDVAGGGVIRFWPAFGLGLGISLVAAVVYALAWELALQLIDADFPKVFADMMVERAREAGATGAELATAVSEAAEFEAMYRKPWLRFPMSMAEFLPVGVLVSLVTAAVLRNPRVLPARG